MHIHIYTVTRPYISIHKNILQKYIAKIYYKNIHSCYAIADMMRASICVFTGTKVFTGTSRSNYLYDARVYLCRH